MLCLYALVGYLLLLQWGILVGHYTLYSNSVFVAPLSLRVVYCDNYHIVINFVCNNHDGQYIKYFISHINNFIMVNSVGSSH